MSLTPREVVQKLIQGIYTATYGTPGETAPVSPEMLKLNEEFKDLFPDKLPIGLPQSRRIYRRIEFQDNFCIHAPHLYQVAPSEDAELQKQLTELKRLGFI